MSAVLKLYECTDDLATVREWLEEQRETIVAAGGECPPELAELLDMAEGNFAEKAERVALFVRELVATAKARREEARRLLDGAEHDERSADSLKQYLLLNMQRAETKKIKGKLVTIRVQKSPAAVHNDLSDADLQRLYTLGTVDGARQLVRRIPESYTIDPRAVVQAQALGEELPAGVTVTQASHVRIV